MKKNNNLFEIFITMFKIGLFTFGGGYAMIALIEDELVLRKKWITKDELMNIVTIAESTPGPIAINCSTYIGYKMGKIFGSIVATLGVCLPSFIIIYIISLFFNEFIELELVKNAFKGIQVAVAFLILTASIRMFKGEKKSLLTILIFSITVISSLMLSLFSKNFSSIFYILFSAILGVIIYMIQCLKKRKKEIKE